MRRREFITRLSGAAIGLPLAAHAQQSKQLRRIGVLMNIAADSQEAPGRVGALAQGLAERGWTIGGNVQVDYRWYAGDADASRKYAEELIALAPNVFLATGTLAATALQRTAGSVPIVFTLVSDPVGAGLVDSLAQPGGNLTGFMLSNTARVRNGWTCSSKSPLTLNERLFFGIAPILPGVLNSAPYKPQHHQLEWS
jgi:putative ABC transport system substrate-binding protein